MGWKGLLPNNVTFLKFGVKVIILDKTYFKISNKIRNKKKIQVALYPILVSLYLTLQKLRGVTFKVIAHGYCSPFIGMTS